MNERVGKTRCKSARPRDPTAKVEKFYRAQLSSLVRAMAKAVESEVIPVVKQEKADYSIDAAPDERIARAAAETKTDPTPAEIASGNYRKGKFVLHGLLITIENPRGGVRAGMDRHGREWSIVLPHHYGYIRGATGADGDKIDVFVGPDPDAPAAFIVDQVDPETGEFDEHKVMLGFDGAEAARAGYLGAYEDGWQGLGQITQVSLPALRAWLSRGDLMRPAAGKVPAALTGDAIPTTDRWADRIIAALRSLGEIYIRQMADQYESTARRAVSMAESESTQTFLKSVNQAVGVDMSAMLDQEGLQDYVQAATHQNTQLIRSVAENYFTGIESAVLGGVRGGEAPTKIAQRIREQTGVSRRRARTIARDQTAKLTSEITERRQTQAGVKYYRSSTANDARVTGKPGGKYPNAKISCWGIAQQDIGHGPGVYRWDTGASWGGRTGLHPGRHHINCRCTATPVFEFELPKKAKR